MSKRVSVLRWFGLALILLGGVFSSGCAAMREIASEQAGEVRKELIAYTQERVAELEKAALLKAEKLAVNAKDYAVSYAKGRAVELEKLAVDKAGAALEFARKEVEAGVRATAGIIKEEIAGVVTELGARAPDDPVNATNGLLLALVAALIKGGIDSGQMKKSLGAIEKNGEKA